MSKKSLGEIQDLADIVPKEHVLRVVLPRQGSSPQNHVYLDGHEITRCVRAIKITAGVGEVLSVQLDMLPGRLELEGIVLPEHLKRV